MLSVFGPFGNQKAVDFASVLFQDGSVKPFELSTVWMKVKHKVVLLVAKSHLNGVDEGSSCSRKETVNL